jgi:hypothetical protein
LKGESIPSKSNIPMLATGPTAAILIRQQLLDSYAPSLLNVLQGVGAASNEKIKIISLDDNRPYRPNSPTAAFDSNKYPNVDFVRLNTPYATNFRSEIFIQDTFNFRWNTEKRRVELIAPTDDQLVREAYGTFASECGLETAEIDLISPDDRRNLDTAMVTYAAGGNLEALPGQILISSAPSRDKKLLEQIPLRAGKEFNDTITDLADDIMSSNASLTKEQATAQAVSRVTSQENLDKLKAKMSAFANMQQAYKDVGYSAVEIDFYSELGYKLSQIDHIDEYVQAFHHVDGGNCQVGLLVASPLDAFNILAEKSPQRSAEDNAFCGRVSDLLMEHRNNFAGFTSILPEARSRGCMLRNGMTDRGFYDAINAYYSKKHFEKDQAAIDKGVLRIKERLAEAGCVNAKIIKLPSFLTINSVNALVITPAQGTSTIIRPDTNLSLFEAEIDKILRDNSIPTISMPAQGLAFGDGNLHCATNVLTKGR